MSKMSQNPEKTAKNIEKKSKLFSTGEKRQKCRKRSKYRKTGKKPQKILLKRYKR